MKPRFFLIACCLVLMSTLVMKASDRQASGRGATPSGHVIDCGAEPCDAVARGFLAFFDRRLRGLDGNGRSCADCHTPTDSFQLSPATVEERFRLLEARRLWNPHADDPLFRPIDADDFRINGENATDFSNLRQNGLVRISLPLPSNLRLIDPETGAPSGETFVDVWRMVPSVNDVALTGPGSANPWPRGPNTPARFTFAPCPPRLARNARTYEITLANGTKTRRTSSDPGRALLTGFVGGPPPQDDWNKLDMNGLRGISKTAPYFHNNSAATLEDVVDHYTEFFKRVRVNAAPGVVPLILTTDGVNFDRPPKPEELAALLAYLRKL